MRVAYCMCAWWGATDVLAVWREGSCVGEAWRWVDRQPEGGMATLLGCRQVCEGLAGLQDCWEGP